MVLELTKFELHSVHVDHYRKKLQICIRKERKSKTRNITSKQNKFIKM